MQFILLRGTPHKVGSKYGLWQIGEKGSESFLSSLSSFLGKQLRIDTLPRPPMVGADLALQRHLDLLPDMSMICSF